MIYSDLSRGIKIDLKPIRILFNNLDYGFYYVEPFFDKYLIELNNHRDSEIFEIYPDSIRMNHIPKEIEFSKFESSLICFVSIKIFEEGCKSLS